MANQTNSIPGSGYGNTYIDSLVWGCGWEGGPVTYWFGSGGLPASDSSIGAFTGAAWSAAEMQAFDTALANYSAVCGLTFEQAASRDQANIVWWLAPNAAMGNGTLGMHEVPDGSWPQIYGYFNRDHATWDELQPGGDGYVTVIHELGHGMGLAHPHDGGDHADATKFPGLRGAFSTGTYGLNQGIWTTMSYNDGWTAAPATSYAYGYQKSLMAFDIAALQAIYGANNDTATGDDVYVLPTLNVAGTGWECLWDAGGVDTLSNAGSALGCTINLNAAPLTGTSAGGFVSRDAGIQGGFTIANGVVIENAIGGAGNDALIGNAVGNDLDGGAGVDTMTGGAGNDSYHVDNRSDRVVEVASGGTDSVFSSVTLTLAANLENLQLTGTANVNGSGNALANVLTGNDGANILNGGSGNDILVGGSGKDTLTGSRGTDLFVFRGGDSGTGTMRDVVTDLKVTDGGSGNDILVGGSGKDTLTGSRGTDLFVFRGGDSATGTMRDVVTDLKVTDGDRLDLSAIDADTGTDGDQPFTFIGATVFSIHAGELRFAGNVLAGDVNGDGLADFEIQLTGVRVLTDASIVV